MSKNNPARQVLIISVSEKSICVLSRIRKNVRRKKDNEAKIKNILTQEEDLKQHNFFIAKQGG